MTRFPGLASLAELSGRRATRQDNAERIVSKAQVFNDFKDVVESRLSSAMLEGLEVGKSGAINNFGITPGYAWVPGAGIDGSGAIVTLGAPIVKPRIIDATGRWQHLYLFEDPPGSGVGDVRVSLIPPNLPYFRRARTETGAGTNSRYLDSWWVGANPPGGQFASGDIADKRDIPDGWHYWPYPLGASPRNIMAGVAPASASFLIRPTLAQQAVSWMPPTAEFLWIFAKVRTGANHSSTFHIAGDGDLGGALFLTATTSVAHVDLLAAASRRASLTTMVSIGQARQVHFGFEGAGTELTIDSLDVIAYWSGRA